MTTAHIVTIRQAGAIVGHQLRTGRGPGKCFYFGARTYGDAEAARQAAVREAEAMGLTIGTGRGGSPQGRRTVNSRTPAAGIRWEWRQAWGSAVLYVVASWPDKDGRPRQTSYSTEVNGLEGALDRAIAKRTSCGAPAVNKAALLRSLRAEKRTMTAS